MALRSGFYNSQNEDRPYDATDMNNILSMIVESGIDKNYGEQFRPELYRNMQIKIHPGRAYINGNWVTLDSDMYQTLDAADPTNPRIDALILSWNSNSRAITLRYAVGKPSANPVTPNISFGSWIREMVFCYIHIPAGATSVYDGVTFTSKIGTSSAPYLRSKLDPPDNLMVGQLGSDTKAKISPFDPKMIFAYRPIISDFVRGGTTYKINFDEAVPMGDSGRIATVSIGTDGSLYTFAIAKIEVEKENLSNITVTGYSNYGSTFKLSKILSAGNQHVAIAMQKDFGQNPSIGILHYNYDGTVDTWVVSKHISISNIWEVQSFDMNICAGASDYGLVFGFKYNTTDHKDDGVWNYKLFTYEIGATDVTEYTYLNEASMPNAFSNLFSTKYGTLVMLKVWNDTGCRQECLLFNENINLISVDDYWNSNYDTSFPSTLIMSSSMDLLNGLAYVKRFNNVSGTNKYKNYVVESYNLANGSKVTGPLVSMAERPVSNLGYAGTPAYNLVQFVGYDTNTYGVSYRMEVDNKPYKIIWGAWGVTSFTQDQFLRNGSSDSSIIESYGINHTFVQRANNNRIMATGSRISPTIFLDNPKVCIDHKTGQLWYYKVLHWNSYLEDTQWKSSMLVKAVTT